MKNNNSLLNEINLSKKENIINGWKILEDNGIRGFIIYRRKNREEYESIVVAKKRGYNYNICDNIEEEPVSNNIEDVRCKITKYGLDKDEVIKKTEEYIKNHPGNY